MKINRNISDKRKQKNKNRTLTKSRSSAEIYKLLCVRLFKIQIMNTDIFENFCRNGLCDGEEGMCMFICQCPSIRFKTTKEMVTKEFAESYEESISTFDNSNEADA